MWAGLVGPSNQELVDGELGWGRVTTLNASVFTDDADLAEAQLTLGPRAYVFTLG